MIKNQSYSGPKSGERVLVAFSGHRDSAVAALLLKNQGFDVTALHLNLSDASLPVLSQFESRCLKQPTPNEIKKLAEKLDIPLLIVESQGRFLDQVVDTTLHKSLSGRFALPCLGCNQLVLDTLFELADQKKFDWVSTGHFAQILEGSENKMARISRAMDLEKDQSYFLFNLEPKKVQKLILPLGGISGSIVGKMAEQYKLSAQNSRTGTCAIGTPSYRALIESTVAPSLRQHGSVLGPDGLDRGKHEGVYPFQVGQSQDLPVELAKDEVLFVTAVDATRNSVHVGSEIYLPRQRAVAHNAFWQVPVDGLRELKCIAQNGSHPGSAASCGVFLFENRTIHVIYDEPQRILARGQAVVFYAGGEVLGGAWVESVGDV